MTMDLTGKLGLGINTLQGLIYHAVVVDIPAANQFTCPTLALLGAGKFANSYYVVAFRDVGGAGAAPQGEIRLITAYTTATGIFAHNAFSAALADGDEVLIISPILYEILSIRGGAETLESLDDELDAMLDLARRPPSGDTVMDGNELELYEPADIRPFIFGGGYIDWTGLNAGAGEDTTIRAYAIIESGGVYRLFYNEVFLAAAVPVPILTPHPRDINTQCVPRIMHNVYGIKITAQQALVGGGWNTLACEWFDALRGG